jgi:dienelactone hydrolase
MAPTADANNFIIVAPTGLSDSRFRGNCDNGGGYCGWNGAGVSHSPGPEGATCNPSVQRSNLCYRDTCTDKSDCADICSWGPCNDDASMVHSLLDQIEEEFCVDTSRVYAGGESNGAMMTWQMGTDSRAARFAAMSATIGLTHHGYDFLPAVLPMPIMGIWGQNDRTIPPGGTSTMGFSQSSDGWFYTTGRQITSDWAAAHGSDVSRSPSTYRTSADGQKRLACTAWSGSDVVDCRFNGGHEVEAFVPSLMWEFFSKHTRTFKSSKPSEVVAASGEPTRFQVRMQNATN